MHNNAVHMVAFILLIIGGLNWGLVGLFSFDLVDVIFGSIAGLDRIIYILVGISAVYVLVMKKKMMTDKGGK